MGVDTLKPRAVFLDRDGVLTRALVRDGQPYPPASLDDMQLLPGVPEALARLKAAGFALVVVSNQPDVARGLTTKETVDAINARLIEALPLDEVRVCLHDDRDRCACRKPGPGLLLEPPLYDVSGSFMVGDRWRDIEAGRRAGCRATILVDYGYDEPAGDPTRRVASLAEAADWILHSVQPAASRMNLTNLKVKIYGDGADLDGMVALAREPFITGFTTNPTLMRKAGVGDYRAFARQVIAAIPDKPISFEVFSDAFDEMERQAHEIATWGSQVYVKIPVTNTRREPAYDLIHRLAAAGVKVNVTAVMTIEQVRQVAQALRGGPPSNVSVFAGRIADTGRDPVPIMAEAVEVLRAAPQAELIWASPRELLNIFQADQIGCHIITVTHDVLKKLVLIGKDLADYSLETVRMFHDDAQRAGYSL